jgi:hypothetical protein
VSTIKSTCRKQETKEESFIGENIEGEKMKESSYYENLVKRYAKLFHKIRDYYAMDYGSRFKPYYTDKNKIKYVNDENGKRPYWYVPNELH